MTVTDVRKDPATRTLSVDAEFDAPTERVWQLFADPRQLERWWGPPTHPATVTSHDLRPGGRVDYFMTGPEGDQPHAYWEVVEVEEPRRLVLRLGFAKDDGTPDDRMPMPRMDVTITGLDHDRSRMTMETLYPDVATMEQLLAMGMEEGLTSAVGQIDAILAEDQVATPRQG